MRLEKDYEPGITFLVVQKRHHVRFFPTNREDQVRIIYIQWNVLLQTPLGQENVSSLERCPYFRG